MDSIKIWIRARSIYGLNLTGICHSMEFIGTNLIQVIRGVIMSDGDM